MNYIYFLFIFIFSFCGGNKEERLFPKFLILESEHSPGKYLADDPQKLGFSEYLHDKISFSRSNKDRMITLRAEIPFSEDCFLVIPPTEYPLNMYLNGHFVFSRGSFKKVYSSRIHFSSAVPVQKEFLRINGKNEIAFELYPKEGETLPFAKVFLSDRKDAFGYVFWRNVLGPHSLQAISMCSLIFFFYFVTLYFYNREKIHFLYFGLLCFSFIFSYSNNYLSSDYTSTLDLERIVRVTFPLSTAFSLAFLLEYTNITRWNKFLVLLEVIFYGVSALLPLFAGNLEILRKINYSFIMPVCAVGNVAGIIISITYYMERKNSIAFSFMIMTSFGLGITAYDMYHFIVVGIKPYIMLVPLYTFIYILFIFFLLAKEQSEIQKISILNERKLIVLNENLEKIVEARTEEIQKQISSLNQEIEIRIKVEQLLKKLTVAVEQSPVSIVITDRNGVTEYVNPTFSSITGYLPEEVIGLNQNLLKGETPKEVYEDLWKTVMSGKIWKGELINRKKNGELYYEETVISPITNFNNELINFIAVKRDVTEDKTIQSQLNILATAIEKSPIVIVITDIHGIIEYVNPVFSAVSGYSYSESVGKSTRMLKGETPSHTIRQLWDTILSGNVWKGEFINHRKNGDLYYEEATIAPIIDSSGKVVNFIALKSDISNRKITEQKLIETEKKFEQLITAVPISLIFVKNNGEVEFHNDRFSELFGYTMQDIPTVNEWWKLAFPETEYRNRAMFIWNQAVEDALGGSRYIEPLIFHINCRSGEIRTVEISGLLTEKGYLAAFTDITERMQNLEKLEKQHKDLKAAQTQLVHSEKMAALGTMVAGVAHEINNPVNYVYLSSEALQRDLRKFKAEIQEMTDSDDEETNEYFSDYFNKFHKSIDNILEGSARIKTIVQDLRIFSRLNEAEKKTIFLQEAVESSLRIAKTQYKEIEFITNFRSERIVECYPAQLNQVFLNILINGCQAVHKRLNETDDQLMGIIQMHLYDTYNETVVSFSDNGIGMSEEEKKRVFEPFYTTKPVGQGTGLGMSISYSIIEKHNGYIKVQSERGKGTVIEIHLPS